ncbi:MAG: hypothetical protein HY909_14170 [Deltaproteobacteria bacterium]|nr:hypothetical protein [Deltaproteobacteria bacterium]
MRGRALFLCLFLSLGRAEAQSPPVDDLIRRALELRRGGRDAEALDLLARAWERSPSPRLSAQLGFAEQALGRWLEAEAHLRGALVAAEDPWVSERRAVIEGALREVERHLGGLSVRCATPGAELWVEGHSAGAFPRSAPERVVAGLVHFEVRARGYQTEVRTMTVLAGGVSEASVALVALGPSLGVGAPDAGVPPPAPGGAHRTWAWVTTAGAALGLGLGVTFLVVRNAAAERWNDPSCLREGRARGDNCLEDLDDGRAAEAVSVAGFVLGGALTALAAVLWATAPSQPEGALAVRCAPGLGAPGLTCAGVF